MKSFTRSFEKCEKTDNYNCYFFIDYDYFFLLLLLAKQLNVFSFYWLSVNEFYFLWTTIYISRISLVSKRLVLWIITTNSKKHCEDSMKTQNKWHGARHKVEITINFCLFPLSSLYSKWTKSSQFLLCKETC